MTGVLGRVLFVYWESGDDDDDDDDWKKKMAVSNRHLYINFTQNHSLTRFFTIWYQFINPSRLVCLWWHWTPLYIKTTAEDSKLPSKEDNPLKVEIFYFRIYLFIYFDKIFVEYCRKIVEE